jgi:hypothetical protein
MAGKVPENKKELLWAAASYWGPLSVFISLYARSAYVKLHAKQGIALLAYHIVGLIIVDIVCGWFKVASWVPWLIIACTYIALVTVFSILVYKGVNVDLKIHPAVSKEG